MVEYKIYNEDQVFDCYSSSIAPICTLQNYEFEFMFLKNWDYKFNFFTIEGLIGGSVVMDSNLLNTSLLDFHGIQVYNKKIKDEKEFYLYYQQQNLSELGCAVSYDSFHAPWLSDYKQNHNTHISLVKGIDSSGNLICSDGIPYMEKAILPLSSLFTEKPVTIYSCKKINNINKIDYQNILKEIYQSFYCNHSPYEIIKKYGDMIRDYFVLEKENMFDQKDYWYLAPFLTDLKNMAQKRKSMSYSIEYMYQNYQDINLLTLKNRLNELADLWYQLVMICWKIFLSHEYSNEQARHMISSYIYNCAKEEELVAQMLLF